MLSKISSFIFLEIMYLVSVKKKKLSMMQNGALCYVFEFSFKNDSGNDVLFKVSTVNCLW